MRNHGKSLLGKSEGRSGRLPGCARMDPLDGCVPFCGASPSDYRGELREKRDGAISMVRDVNRVGPRIHCCHQWEAAHSFVHDLDVAIIHVPGAAGVAVERRHIGIAGDRDVNDDASADRQRYCVRGCFVAPFPALSGNAPTTTAGGGDCGQPEVLVPLQVAPSTIDTVRSSRFPMKTVFLSNTIPTARGAAPAGNVATTF